jgi:hypothetical protein
MLVFDVVPLIMELTHRWEGHATVCGSRVTEKGIHIVFDKFNKESHSLIKEKGHFIGEVTRR